MYRASPQIGIHIVRVPATGILPQFGIHKSRIEVLEQVFLSRSEATFVLKAQLVK